MRSRSLLKALVLSSLIILPATLFGQKSKPTPSLTMRQEVDLEMMNLQKNVVRAKTSGEAFGFVAKTVVKIKLLRQGNPEQWNDDEIYFDHLSGSLEEISRADEPAKALSEKSCTQRRGHVLRLYDPKAHGNTKDQALQKSLDVLSEICKKTF